MDDRATLGRCRGRRSSGEGGRVRDQAVDAVPGTWSPACKRGLAGDRLRRMVLDVHEVRVRTTRRSTRPTVSEALDEHGPLSLSRWRTDRLCVTHRESAVPDRPAVRRTWRPDVRRRGPSSAARARDRRLVMSTARSWARRSARGAAGMSLITVPLRMGGDRVEPRALRVGHSWSMLDGKHRWIDGGRVAFPYTPSVSDLNGVHAALEEVLDEGPDAVIATHRQAARACRAGVRRWGSSCGRKRIICRQLRDRGPGCPRESPSASCSRTCASATV